MAWDCGNVHQPCCDQRCVRHEHGKAYARQRTATIGDVEAGIAGSFLQHKVIPTFVEFIDRDGAMHRTNVAHIVDVKSLMATREGTCSTRIFVANAEPYDVVLAWREVNVIIDGATRGA